MPFTASKRGYNISTPKKNMQYQSHSTPPSISPIQNDMRAVYITKEANMLHLILGSNELVLAIDKVKIDFKSFPQFRYIGRNSALILRTETKLKNELTAWEVEFVKKNNNGLPVPTLIDKKNNGFVGNIMNQLSYIRRLKMN